MYNYLSMKRAFKIVNRKSKRKGEISFTRILNEFINEHRDVLQELAKR